MNQEITRADFLQVNISGKNRSIRPPWAVAEALFLHRCNQCGECITKCPTHILIRARGRYPVVDFNRGECLLCGDCARQCEAGALGQPDNTVAWSLTAHIDSAACLAFKSIECRSCLDPCESRAIAFTHQPGAAAIPAIETDLCNGCGACFATCPVTAIDMQPNPEIPG